MAVRYAGRMNELKASEIRELLKITERPEVISFAGGLPAPELFPVKEMKEISAAILEEEGRKALQYATTEGLVSLREKIARRMNAKFKTSIGFENILITSGSQQGLDFTGKVFLDKGDVVLCESPSYLGAINAFKAYEAKFVEVPTDSGGMILDELERILSTTPNVKLIYVVPDFQNPTGRSWSEERRRGLMEIANRFEIPVVEDNPYGELRFEGVIPPSLMSMDEKGIVIFLGTFSKILCPGLRIGWIAAGREVLEKYILVKQGADLQSSTLAQRKIDRFMELYDIDAYVEKLKRVYARRRDVAVEAMKSEFPGTVGFTVPEGGLFTWVELPPCINARDLLVRCLELNVAFVPGGAFFPNGEKENAFRLNYSNMPEDRIIEGIRRIGAAIREYLH